MAEALVARLGAIAGLWSAIAHAEACRADVPRMRVEEA